MVSTVVGYKQFMSKKLGKQCNVMVLLTDFTPAENARGNYGQGAQEIFLNDDIAQRIKPDCIGKQVNLIYSLGAGGRPVLDDVTIVGK